MHGFLLAISMLAVALSTGCLDEPPASHRSTDGGPPLHVEEWEVLDFGGASWPPRSAPRRPTIRLHTSRAALGDPLPLWLLRGEPTRGLETDLASSPLRLTHLERSLEIRVLADGRWLSLEPLSALRPGQAYTVAMGGWVTDARGSAASPFSVGIRIADSPDAGAAAVATWPPEGASGVPPQLPLVAVQFDGYVTGWADAGRLVDERGAPVPIRAEELSCTTVGWRAGTCVAFSPMEPLEAASTHSIVFTEGLRDATGANVGPFESRFTTGTSDARPASWLTDSCAIDEVSVGPACVLADEDSVRVRVRSSGPVRIFLHTDGGPSDVAVAARGSATLRLEGLRPRSEFSATLRAIDLMGRETEARLQLQTTHSLPPLSITEVRSDPLGPEPRQEYVEVLNSGAEDMDLLGFRISDREDREGDLVARSYVLPAGARALIVADGFDPTHELDVATPAGVLLVRVGTSIASGGLSNAGEALFLRDPQGHRVSAAPSAPPPRPGVCRVRIVEDGRTGHDGSFAHDAEGGCTPGGADRVP